MQKQRNDDMAAQRCIQKKRKEKKTPSSKYFQLFKRLFCARASPNHQPPPLHPQNVCERSDIVLVVLGVTQGCISLSVVWVEHTRCGGAPPRLHVWQ